MDRVARFIRGGSRRARRDRTGRRLRGVTPEQRELLQDLRARVDAGEFVEPFPDQKDRVALALGRIVGVGQFEQMIEWMKDKEDRPWAEVPDDLKVSILVDAAVETGPPGDYALRAIEREVDYGKLSPWRREAMEGLHPKLGRGELDGENPNPSHQDDKAGFGLRLAEFEARVEDNKRLGALDGENRRWPWRELSEDQKLDSLAFDIRALNLDNESMPYEIVGREVDLTRVPEWRRSHVQSHLQPEVMDASREASGFSESRIVEAQPKLPSPSDIAKDKQPYTADQFRDHGHGRDR